VGAGVTTHSETLVAPVTPPVYFPMGHMVHSTAPNLSEYVFTGQSLHVEVRSMLGCAENLPMGHPMHTSQL
jgi:hypothetical protein